MNPHQHHHGHDHHDHHHHHHEHQPAESRPNCSDGPVLVIRPNSGLSGDMLVAGLLTMAGAGPDEIDGLLADLGLDKLKGRVRLVRREVSEVGGVGLAADLPHEHEHRTLKDMEDFFAQSAMSSRGREMALKIFRLLAEAEGEVHGKAAEDVHFHEVGALDSIMDIGLAAELLSRLAPCRIVCGPLPVCDGVIRCQHGLLPAPAPAVLKLLKDVPVVGLSSRGETVTPTAIAILKGCGAEFGPWPALVIERQAIAYGTRVLEGVPNGAIFALGRGHNLNAARETI